MSQNQSRSHSKRSQKNTRRQTQKKFEAKRKKTRNRDCMKLALKTFFDRSSLLSEYEFNGNIKWQANDMAQLGLLFSWSEKKCVTDAFNELVKRSGKLGIPMIHTTYQGFIGALTNYVHLFMPALILLLQQLLERSAGKFWRTAGFVAIAFDGSRESAPRTASNEQALCSSKSLAKRAVADEYDATTHPQPQIWITMLWHMGTRLPWNWCLGPSDSSERHHVMEMISQWAFPPKTLFCGDAGFVGYEFWKSIIDEGHDFMVRVGSNVHLLGNQIGYATESGGEVLCWPKDKQGKCPPLKLRLAQVTIGKTKVYLLTSVLDSSELDREAMIELYKLRWGIEVEFRGLKQTLNGSKLRCRNAERAYTELHYSILAMAVAETLATREQIATKSAAKTYTPKDRSLANIMRAIYDCLDELNEPVPQDSQLSKRLDQALTDNYQRKYSKQARYRPPTDERKKKKVGKPKIRKMEPSEKENLEKQQCKIAT